MTGIQRKMLGAGEMMAQQLRVLIVLIVKIVPASYMAAHYHL